IHPFGAGGTGRCSTRTFEIGWQTHNATLVYHLRAVVNDIADNAGGGTRRTGTIDVKRGYRRLRPGAATVRREPPVRRVAQRAKWRARTSTMPVPNVPTAPRAAGGQRARRWRGQNALAPNAAMRLAAK